MTADELRERAGQIRWFHSIDLGHGLVTPGVDDSRLRLDRLGLPEDLTGLTVLDVGAWDGFYSFEAERRGARRVVAADHYAWHGTGWGTGNGKAGFEFARNALQSRVEDLDIDVLDLTKNVGVFDVVLFLGVLYHLPDPLLGLQRVANVTGRQLIVETVVDMVGFSRPSAAFYPGQELSDDPTNWWGPNHAAVVGMLRAVGFDVVTSISPIPSAPYRAARAAWHAARGKNSFRRAFRQDRAVFHAFRTPRP